MTAVEYLFTHLFPYLDFSKVEDRIKIRQFEQDALNMEGKQLAGESWEGCDGCTEQDEVMYKNGYLHGYNAAIAELPKEEPKQETLEEAAENYNNDFQIKSGSKAPHIKNVYIMNHFIEGAKWYREQLKQK